MKKSIGITDSRYRSIYKILKKFRSFSDIVHEMDSMVVSSIASILKIDSYEFYNVVDYNNTFTLQYISYKSNAVVYRSLMIPHGMSDDTRELHPFYINKDTQSTKYDLNRVSDVYRYMVNAVCKTYCIYNRNGRVICTSDDNTKSIYVYNSKYSFKTEYRRIRSIMNNRYAPHSHFLVFRYDNEERIYNLLYGETYRFKFNNCNNPLYDSKLSGYIRSYNGDKEPNVITVYDANELSTDGAIIYSSNFVNVIE